MKLVINRSYGGFALSPMAMTRLLELGCVLDPEADWEDITHWGGYEGHFSPVLRRDDPRLVHVVEELGELAACLASQLKVIEIPDDVSWEIKEHEGAEWVAEKHRTWA